jgi:hypothetical protein
MSSPVIPLFGNDFARRAVHLKQVGNSVLAAFAAQSTAPRGVRFL